MMESVLLFGHTGDIGSAIQRGLINCGYDVIGISRSDSFLGKGVDFSNRDEIKNTKNELLGRKFKAIVVCIGYTIDSYITKVRDEDLYAIIEANFIIPFKVVRDFVSLLDLNINPQIVLLSSIASEGNFGQSVYGSTKGAINSLTKTLAIEFGKLNICVNAISPGLVESQMVDKIPNAILKLHLERRKILKMTQTSEIAKFVEYLVKYNETITGQIIKIDGGV